MRTAPQQSARSTRRGSRLAFFSCWCPKVISQINRLPPVLADRCIVLRLWRKLPEEECERLRKLKTKDLRQQCARVVLDHGEAIANAEPAIPDVLNDRAADIWEPLLAIAELAGGDWPERARQAAIGLSAAQDSNPTSALLLDIFAVFTESKVDRLFTRELVSQLNASQDGMWSEVLNGKNITERCLSKQLRPFGIVPGNIWFNAAQAKVYVLEDFQDVF